MNTKHLHEIAQNIVSKTILAADESTGTITKRLASINITSTPDINLTYRQMLFTADAIGEYVSGVILYDETLRQSIHGKTSVPQYLHDRAIIPGIKVDKSTRPTPGSSPDTYTQGFDELDKRLQEYRRMDAQFAKWRAVYTISGDTHPSDTAILRNAHDLALYARLCQEYDIVPIVEPEVLMDGTHSFETDSAVTTNVLSVVFDTLSAYHVDLAGIILKPNMVTAGTEHTDQKSVEEVAQKTLEVLSETVPPEVPGIAFLSGGQSPDLATEHLNAINVLAQDDTKKYPWRLTASFGRALQGEALDAWGGDEKNVEKAQKVFIGRAEKVYKASRGTLNTSS